MAPAAFILAGLAASGAAAQSAATADAYGLAHLNWHTPAGVDCPSQPEIERAVERHLGRRVFAAPGTHSAIEVDARIARDGQSLIAVVRTGGRERRLVGATDRCAAIAETVALVLSLLVDLPADRSTLRLPRPASEPWALQVSAGAALGRDLLPGIALAGTFAAAVLSPGELLLIEPSLWLWAPRERHEGGSGARWSAWSGALAICARFWHTSAVATRACGDAQVGAVQVSGLMLQAPRDSTRLWMSAGARLRWELRLASAVGLGADVGGEFPLRRDAFYYEGRGGSRIQLHRVPAVVPVFAVAIFVRWS